MENDMNVENKRKEELRTEFMSMASDNVKTDVMPSISDNVKTDVMPSISDNVKTSVMSNISDDVKTGMMHMDPNGIKTEFMNETMKQDAKKLYENSGANNKEKIIVNDKGDRHYKTIGKWFNGGGEAKLYHVECVETGEKFVAKIYNSEAFNDHIDSFCEEVHPVCSSGLMEIHDRGYVLERDNRAYILPDYSGTNNLFQYLESHSLSEEKIITLIKNLSESLNIMHIKGYYHRDIKPDNILYDDNLERPIIIDYGIVTSANLAISDVALTETAKGTPGYRPPEFYESFGESAGSEVEASPKYDFFQLGLVVCDIYCSIYAGKAERFCKDNKSLRDNCRRSQFKFPPKLEKNERMVNLVKALLCYNPIKRAGYKEVSEWLKGAVLEIEYSQGKEQYMYQFDSKDCHSEEELARTMALNWKRGVEEVTRGRLGGNYKTKLGMEYKGSSDKISNIEYYYENISPDISKHAALAEIIALLGKNMAFAWKGCIYEDEDGNTDYPTIADELYKDASNSEGREFDELVSSRALKELLYPQIRFVDEGSSDVDKQKVGYYECMKKVEYINNMAKKSMKLAKYFLAEICHTNAQSGSMDSYIIDIYTKGKVKDLNVFIKSAFTTDNIDSAIKVVNSGDVDFENPVLQFLDDYNKNDCLRACMINGYNLDYSVLDEIKMGGSKTGQILELVVLLAFCDEQNSNIIGIKDTFMKTCYVNIICAYIKEKNSWEYIDIKGNTKAKEYRKRLDYGEDILEEELSKLEDHRVFCSFVRHLMDLQELIVDVIKIFVYDRRILESGMILCTEMTGSNVFIESAIIPKDEKSNLCLVDGNFLVPKCIVETYCKGRNKIDNPKPQKDIEVNSIEATYEYVKEFRNSFRNLVGTKIDELLSQKKVKLCLNACLAVLVVLVGVGLFLSGIIFKISKEFDDGSLNKTYSIIVVIVDLVLGCILMLRHERDLRISWENLRLYKKNKELRLRAIVIDQMVSKLISAKKSKRIEILNSREKEIISLSRCKDNSANVYIAKYDLSCDNSSYRRCRPIALFFAGLIWGTLFMFNHIPARNVLGAMLNNNIEQAEVYSRSNESLPNIVKVINDKITYKVLAITEDEATKELMNQYNLGKIDNEKFKKERTVYYSLCERAGYAVDKNTKNSLDRLDMSKAEYTKGSKIRKEAVMNHKLTEKKKEEVAKHYLNVIPEDSDYTNANEFLTFYLTGLYKKQQKFIENNNEKALSKLTTKYGELLAGTANDSTLKEIYNILNSKTTIEQKAKELVALQMYYKGKEWDEDGVSRFSCKQFGRGKYYVQVQKKNSGFARLFNKYNTTCYVFKTYTCDFAKDIPKKIKFDMKDFEPNISQKEYLALMK